MAAIMELEEDKIREICLECGAELANINCPEQIIITWADRTGRPGRRLERRGGRQEMRQVERERSLAQPLH